MSLTLTAQRLVNKFGRSITLKAEAAAAADPLKPWRGASDAALETVTLKAVFQDAQSQGVASAMGMDPIRQGKQMFIVAGLDLGSFDLDRAREVADGSDTWRVTSVERIKPGSDLIAAMLEVQK